MLALSREPGEILVFDIPPNCPPGPIIVVVREINHRRSVRMAIKAPIQVNISRMELLQPERQAVVRCLVEASGQKAGPTF